MGAFLGFFYAVLLSIPIWAVAWLAVCALFSLE